MKRRTILRAVLGTAVAGAAGMGAASLWLRPVQERQGLREFVAADLAFGTTVSLKVLHEDEAAARAAMRAALDAVRDIDRLMSLHRPDSEISRLNRDGVVERPDARVVQVLQHAQALSQGTGGAFDVTVQPLWLAAASGGDRDQALRRVDWRQLTVDTDRIALRRPGMAVTLNGVAQGYGVDVALAALQQHGIDAQVVTQLAPAWTTDWMSESGKEKLRQYGIAPPGRAADGPQVVRFIGRPPTPDVVPCPRCGSSHTVETSRFASTACKALYKCLACQEPFDYFKPY